MKIPYSDQEKTATRWLKETQKGYIRIAVLILLNKRPYHGYEIMREIKEKTIGHWRPTAGGIYPILLNLEKLGYVEGKWDLQGKRKRKIYRITGTGRMILEQALAKERQITDSMSSLFAEFMKDVFHVEAGSIPMRRIPNPFSVFLEERKEKPEDTISTLEDKRMQIENMVEELRKQLLAINKRLSRLNSQQGKNMRQGSARSGKK